MTEQIKQQILAEYLSLRNYCAVAKKHGISNYRVKKVVDEKLCNAKTSPKNKKNEDEKIESLIDLYLCELSNRERICDAPLNQIASVLGVVMDKFTKGKTADSGQLSEIIEAVKYVK